MITTSSYPWMTRDYLSDEALEEADKDILDHRCKTQPGDPDTPAQIIDMRTAYPTRGD
jgi:hypothetical protein